MARRSEQAVAFGRHGLTPPLLLDGGTGSELRRRGVQLDPMAWSAPATLTHAHTLTDIHADYLDAGADVITTNTFGATRFVLDAAGLGHSFERIVSASVTAARRAQERTGRKASIAGSISCLPPGFDIGAYPPRAVERAAYEELATRLAESGVDILALEMMEDTEHARLALDAARTVGLPIWLGVSIREAPDNRLVAYDFPDILFEDVLDTLLYDGLPTMVNVMHSPADAVTPALRAIRTRWTGDMGAYPELYGDAKDPVTETPLVSWAEEWLREGISLIGGCCGTTPRHIRALRTLINGASPPSAPADRQHRSP